MLTTEIKKELKDCGYSIESESPLKLTNEYETLIGIPATLKIKELMDELIEDLDLSQLKTMNDEDCLLVSADVNYADEFDMKEWSTMSVAEFKAIVKQLKKHKEEIEWSFGTNEELHFSDGEDLLNQFSFKLISQEESDVLNKLFGGGFDGGAGVFDHIAELDDDSDDETFPSKGDMRMINFLKKHGWEIKVHNEDEGQFEFKHSDEGYAISDVCLLEDLVKHYKRKK